MPKKCKKDKTAPKITFNITYVSNPDPAHLAAWRRMWDRLLAPRNDVSDEQAKSR